MALTNIQPDPRFQDSILETDLMTPTTSAGTPAAGTFYSSISGRKSIVDLRKDLKPRMGVERIQTQALYPIQDEFGSNNEPVWGLLNDDKGLFRAVGSGWQTFQATYGNHIQAATTSDYAEITFYGTGLNIFSLISLSRDIRVSIDGGTESGNLTAIAATGSTVIEGIGFVLNEVFNVASGLSLGVHTVKIRLNSGANLPFHGYEVLNESSQININPGLAQIGNKKTYLASQQLTAYNSGFESGVLGTRGGRVVTYLKKDGTIGKAVQPVDAAQANYTAASHANEEVARTYHWREFGAGRSSDDFNTLGTSSRLAAFTLDDGTTTLIGSSATLYDTVAGGVFSNGVNQFITFTFVGTGLDIISTAQGTITCTYSLAVDGTTIQSGITGLPAKSRIKVVSGLPYGTHTVKLTCTAQTGPALQIMQLVVYQPKKPSIPAGAIELADYNILGNFSANTTAGSEFVSQGVLRKTCMREFIYSGTWATGANVGASTAGSTSGWIVNGATAGNFFQYTFFGTGFDLRVFLPGTTGTNATVSIDGSSNLSAYTTSFYGSVTSFTASTGVYTTSAANNYASGLTVSGLSLGLHTVKVSYNSGSAFGPEAIDIITPIHSHKSNLYGDLGNTLSVGSCAISDNRKTSAIKEGLPAQKAWAQAVGISSNPTTTSTSYVPLPDMSTTIRIGSPSSSVKIQYSADVAGSLANQAYGCYIYINGLPYFERLFNAVSNGNFQVLSDSVIVPLSAGTHKVDIYWAALGGGTMTAYSTRRSLVVEER